MWKHPLSFVSSKIRLLFHGRIHQKCDHLRYLMKTSPEWTLLWPHVWCMMVESSLDPYLETCWPLPTNTLRWEQMGPPEWSTGFKSTVAPPYLWCGPIPRVSFLICKTETAVAVLFLLHRVWRILWKYKCFVNTTSSYNYWCSYGTQNWESL